MIVLDASIMVAWLLSEPGLPSRPQIDSLLQNESLLVPAHWPAEIGNALLINLRRKRLTQTRLEAMLADLESLVISQPPPETADMASLFEFAETHGLTFYDALYVYLCVETGAQIATLDHAMRAAAQRLNIPLIPA